MKGISTTLLALIALSGCTSVEVSSLADHHNPELICLQMNPRVIVGGFEEVIEKRLQFHGINTRRYDGYREPRECQYTLSYTAHKTWDVAAYLHRAELYLSHKGTPIATAVYRLRGKGGFSLMKWASVESKMNPVVDELLGVES